MIAGVFLYCITAPIAGIHVQETFAQALLAQGRYSVALPILQAALQRAAVVNDSEYPSILSALGSAFYDLGKLRDARQVYEQALDAFRLRGDIAARRIAETMDSLGAVYLKLNLLHKAEDTLLQAADLHGQSDDEIGRAKALLNLGSVYRAEHAPLQAESALRESLAIRERVLPPNDPDIALAANNLGVLLRDLKRFHESEPLLLRALAVWRASLPPNHPLTAAALNNLGVLYTTLGRFDEAEQCLSRSVQIARASLPPDHPNLASYMNDYAYLLRKLNRKKEAAQLQSAARAAHQRYTQQNALGLTVDARQSFH